MGGQTFEVTIDADQATVFAAAVATAARLGYTISEARPEVGVLSFNTGRSMKSWAGQDMTATVIAVGTDKTQVIVGGALARHGAQLQLGAWGEKKALATKYIALLQEAINQPAGTSSATGLSGALPSGYDPAVYRPCPECAKPIRHGATRCQHCSARV